MVFTPTHKQKKPFLTDKTHVYITKININEVNSFQRAIIKLKMLVKTLSSKPVETQACKTKRILFARGLVLWPNMAANKALSLRLKT